MLTPVARTTHRSRFGFTLVEMLVSVALVMLIMVLLAQVFGIAAGSMEKNRATSANDQQARTFVSIIKGDLCARSFRFVYPFSPSKSNIPDPITGTLVFAPGPHFISELRRGYFCISENDPDNPKDDVISFTVDYSPPSGRTLCLHRDNSGLYGRATLLGGGSLQMNPNQPEFDDGYPISNSLGVSQRAEVVYFLRNGNLYRRVMLLRDAYDDSTDSSGTGQPTDNTGDYLLNPNNPSGSDPNYAYPGQFWDDFDYSVVFNTIEHRPYFLNGSASGGHPSSLENDNISENLIPFDFGNGQADVPLSLGIPHFRFGHNINDLLGRPKEFIAGPNGVPGNPGDDNGDGTVDDFGELGAKGSDDIFIGRFLAQENAHPSFRYPGANPDPLGSPSSNPHNRTDLDLNPNNGLVQPYSNQTPPSRRGEEILLTDVIEFDVKVWDEGIRQFVDLGHEIAGGHYHRNRNAYFDSSVNPDIITSGYGNRYDTWHPHGALGEPPYRPTSVGIDRAPGQAGVDDNGDGTVDTPAPGPPPAESPERGWLGTDDEVRLKAIQITIRYMDPQEKLVRHVTITESLTD